MELANSSKHRRTEAIVIIQKKPSSQRQTLRTRNPALLPEKRSSPPPTMHLLPLDFLRPASADVDVPPPRVAKLRDTCQPLAPDGFSPQTATGCRPGGSANPAFRWTSRRPGYDRRCWCCCCASCLAFARKVLVTVLMGNTTETTGGDEKRYTLPNIDHSSCMMAGPSAPPLKSVFDTAVLERTRMVWNHVQHTLAIRPIIQTVLPPHPKATKIIYFQVYIWQDWVMRLLGARRMIL